MNIYPLRAASTPSLELYRKIDGREIVSAVIATPRAVQGSVERMVGTRSIGRELWVGTQNAAACCDDFAVGQTFSSGSNGALSKIQTPRWREIRDREVCAAGVVRSASGT